MKQIAQNYKSGELRLIDVPRNCEEKSKTVAVDDALQAIARATRKYTIGQVRARQIINAHQDLPTGAIS